jgi:hypothetical protein
MGHGSYSGEVHRSTTLKRLAEGTDFSYSKTTFEQPRSQWKVHESVDPKRKNQKGDHEGTIIRESLDFEEHPNTTPIVVMFDVTGSMSTVPRVIVSQLLKLIDALHEAKVPDPQLLVGAIGDAYSDTLPLQIGQFESDNRIDEQINSLVLEGGGGGGNHESYELAAYFLANYTHLDSVELRDEKALCFFIGDERLYKEVQPDQVKKHIGEKLPQAVLTQDVFADLKEKFEVFLLMSEHGGYTRRDSVDTKASEGGEGGYRRFDQRGLCWDQVVDAENILVMSDASKLSEKIAQVVTSRKGERIEA